jgi:tellurite resistance-related uncharacterized protein
MRDTSPLSKSGLYHYTNIRYDGFQEEFEKYLGLTKLTAYAYRFTVLSGTVRQHQYKKTPSGVSRHRNLHWRSFLRIRLRILFGVVSFVKLTEEDTTICKKCWKNFTNSHRVSIFN